MLVLALTLRQLAVTVPEPSVSTVAVAFTGVCLLWLVNVIVKSRDNGMKTTLALHGLPGQPGMIERMEQMAHAMFGVPGDATKPGLVVVAARIDESLTIHCTEERAVWNRLENERERMRREVREAATEVLADVQLEMSARLVGLENLVRELGGRPPRKGGSK